MCAAACRVTHALQGGNQISDGGASSLSEALKLNTCLRELRLVSAGCGRGGDVEVAMCMFVHAVVCVAGLHRECVFDCEGGQLRARAAV